MTQITVGVRALSRDRDGSKEDRSFETGILMSKFNLKQVAARDFKLLLLGPSGCHYTNL